MNKKGFFAPWILGAVVFVIFAMVLVVSVVVFDNVMTGISDSVDLREDVEESVDDVGVRLPQSLDGISLLFFGGLLIGGVVVSWFSNFNPVFFGLLFLVSLSLLFGPMLFSNLWVGLVEDPSLSVYRASFPITDFLMSNYLWLWLGSNALFLFVVGRNVFGGGQGGFR